MLFCITADRITKSGSGAATKTYTSLQQFKLKAYAFVNFVYVPRSATRDTLGSVVYPYNNA